MKPGRDGDRGSDTAPDGPNGYRFESRWELAAPRTAVWDVFDRLVDGPDPFAWWPDLVVLGRGEDEIHVEARSGLGYRLRFRLHGLWTRPPGELGLASDGDLAGTARVTIEPEGEARSVVRIVWQVDVTRRWMRWTSPLLRPLFVAGHHLVMRRGHRALAGWLTSSRDRGGRRRRRR